MLSANLTYRDNNGNDVPFNLQTYLVDGSRRIDALSTITEPRLMEIKHTVSGKGPATVDRHLISFSQTKDNVTTGGPKKAIVNLTISVPRTTAFASTDVNNLLAMVVDFLSDPSTIVLDGTNISAVLRSES